MGDREMAIVAIMADRASRQVSPKVENTRMGRRVVDSEEGVEGQGEQWC